MKSFCVSLLVAASLLSAVRADLTITQKAEGTANGTREVIIKIKGDKTRVEVGPQISMIIDSRTGDMITVMSDKKQVMRISGDKAKAMAEMMSQLNKAQTTKPKLVPTGKKETISGYEAEEYKLEGGLMPATYWLSTKYPDYAAILKQLQKTKPASWDPTKMGMPDYSELPGLPVRVIMQMPGQGAVTTTIVSVKQDSLSDDQFAAPKDFKEIEMPDFTHPRQPSAAPAEKKP